MPVVRVELVKGRTEEQKRAFAEDVTQAMVNHCNSKPEDVQIVFMDIDKSDWALAGKLLSDNL